METENKQEFLPFESSAVFSGTQVNYFIVCPVKLWLFSHFVRMEQNSENVKLGKFLHEQSFKREKETMVDQRIAIDFVRKKGQIELHEVKKSAALEKAHYWQLMYYLYYLEKYKGIENATGVINYPKQRKIVKVALTVDAQNELESMLVRITALVENPAPPEKKKLPYCKKCSYYEFCWSE